MQHVENMNIDESRINVLTKIIKKKHKKDMEIKETDHNTINAVLNIKWEENTNVTYSEVYKFNDIDGMRKFKELTTHTDKLSKIFDSEKDLDVQTKKIMKRLNGFISESFKKVKISNKPDTVLSNLFDKRRMLRSQKSPASKVELDKVEKELADRYSDKMYKNIKDKIADMDGEDGGFNPGNLWKLKKKLSPIAFDPPSAMKNTNGDIMYGEDEIKEEALKHYSKVFEDRPIDESIKHIKKEREDLCMARLEKAKENKSIPWTIEDVESVLKSLKKKISKDPYGLPHELFLFSNAGKDLVLAITRLMNHMKTKLVFPKSLELCNVTNAYKNKGERTSYDSYRGLFQTPVFRNILDKLLYADMYETIDASLTDCNEKQTIQR